MSFRNQPTIISPPLEMRERILQAYYQKVKESDHIDALVLYRNSMAALYKRYNPWLKVRFYKRDHFMPKEQEDYDDYY